MTEPVTTSLELSKRLYELGVRKESYFIWRRETEAEGWGLLQSTYMPPGRAYHAYQADELWKVLPETDKHKNSLYAHKYGKGGTVATYYPPHTGVGPNLAEALGLLLEWMIEKELITVEEVNKP